MAELVDDTLSIEVLVQKLTDYIDDKQELDSDYRAAMDSGAYSLDYYFGDRIRYSQKLAREFGDCLSAYIDSRIPKGV